MMFHLGSIICMIFTALYTPPETNIELENGWLEYDRFLLGFGPFSGANC